MKVLDKNKLRQLIGENKVDIIFSTLLDWIDLIGDKSLRVELWVNIASYNNILKNERIGVVTEDEIARQKKNINKSLLDLIELVPGKLETPKEQENELSQNIIYEENPILKPKEDIIDNSQDSKLKTLLSYLAFFLLGVILCLGLFRFGVINSIEFVKKNKLEYQNKNDSLVHYKLLFDSLNTNPLENESSLNTLVLDTEVDNDRLDYLIPKIEKSLLFKLNYTPDKRTLPQKFTDDQKKQDLYIMHWHTYQSRTKNISREKSEDMIIELIDDIKKKESNALFLIYSSTFHEKYKYYKSGIGNFWKKNGRRTNIKPLGFRYKKDWELRDTFEIYEKLIDFSLEKVYQKPENKEVK